VFIVVIIIIISNLMDNAHLTFHINMILKESVFGSC